MGPRPVIKHCIAHVCALKTNDIWLRNLDKLCRGWTTFDGRRVIATVTGDDIHPPDVVLEAFRERVGREAIPEMLVFPNDPKLREVVTFLPLLEAIRNENGCALYTHSKGNSTVDGVPGATRWRNAMYHHLLDRADECATLLERGFSMVGTNKMLWTPMKDHERKTAPRPLLRKAPYPSGIDNEFSWMFAGTFFWFRLDHVFSNERWRKVPADRYAAEAWPGQMFPADQGYSMWDPFHPRHAMSPYDPKWYPAEFDDPI
jgi:hypothetical protein